MKNRFFAFALFGYLFAGSLFIFYHRPVVYADLVVKHPIHHTEFSDCPHDCKG